MFGKLLKYELRTCMRVFLPIWGAILVLAAVNGITLGGGNIRGIAEVVLVVLPALLILVGSVAAVAFAVFFIVRRFYTDLLGDAGYLMFTLPVSTSALVGSKALAALIVELISAAVAGLSALLMAVISVPERMGEFITEFFGWLGSLPQQSPGAIWASIGAALLGVLVLCAINLRVYAAIAVGHLAKKRRMLWSVAAYVGIGIAMSILGVVILPGVAGMRTLFNLSAMESSLSAMGVVLSAAIGWTAVQCAAFFFGTTGILSKRLNLE